MSFNGINRLETTLNGTCSGGEVVVNGSFAPNGTSNPTVTKGDWIESVTYVATGVWDVVLQATGPQFITGLATLQMATFANRSVALGPYTADTRTLRVFGASAGAANDLQTTDVVNLAVTFRLKNITRS